MKHNLLTLLAALAAGGLTLPSARAEIPDTIVLPGRVTVDNLNFTGTGQFKFVIYQTIPGQGSFQLWNNQAGANTGALAEPATAVSLAVREGLYRAPLGDTTVANMAAVPPILDPAANAEAFLRVWFNDGSHGFQLLTPDLTLGAAACALRVHSMDSFEGIPASALVRKDVANRFNHVDGITVMGTAPTGSTPAPGATVPVATAGSRFQYLPGYAALRAGVVTADQWSAANMGVRSIAMGLDPIASGYQSIAFGSGAEATAEEAVAIGPEALASGGWSMAIGRGAEASATYTLALGPWATASGLQSTSLGYNNTASGQSAYTFGEGNTASGVGAYVFGYHNTANLTYATAFGAGNSAGAWYATAAGIGTSARSYGETVFGSNNAVVTPLSTTAFNSGDLLFVVGGAGSGTGRNAFALLKNGNATLRGTLTQGSDRNRKTAIVPVDTAAVLAKVCALPLATWRYVDDTTTHLGPMAQDFFAAFQLGATDTGIALVDADGVALAALQELKSRADSGDTRLDQIDARLAALEAKLR